MPLVTHDVVTPRYRAVSAPEYPNSFTANHENTRRASTTSLLRLPERNSPRDTLSTSQTRSASESKSIFFSPILKFPFIKSLASVSTLFTNSLSPSILWSNACLSLRVLALNTSDQPPVLLINPPPTKSGLLPRAIPSSTNLRYFSLPDAPLLKNDSIYSVSCHSRLT